MRTDIGDRIGKHVGSLLFDQRCFFAFAFRLFIYFAGCLLLLDVSDNHTITDDHLQRIDRTFFWQWENIQGFNETVGRVLECLRQPGSDRRSTHIEIDVRCEPRRFDVTSGFVCLQQKAAGLNLVWRDQSGCFSAGLHDLQQTENDSQCGQQRHVAEPDERTEAGEYPTSIAMIWKIYRG